MAEEIIIAESVQQEVSPEQLTAEAAPDAVVAMCMSIALSLKNLTQANYPGLLILE